MPHTALAVLLFLIVPQTLWAVDKGHMAVVPKKYVDAVVSAFSQVPAYYLLDAEGNSMVRKYPAKSPEFRAPIRWGLTLYLDPRAAEQYRQASSEATKTQYVIKNTPLSIILLAQYAAKDKPSSKDPTDPTHNPDLVFFENVPHRHLTIEYLVEEKSRKPYVARRKGTSEMFVPAFVSRQVAIEAQKKLEKKTKRKYARIGQDFSSFVKTIQSFADKKMPVMVFGYALVPEATKTEAQVETPPKMPAKTQAALRTWTSVTGKFKIEARFVRLEDDVLTLERKSGQTLNVSIEKLSEADRAYAKAKAASN